MEQTPNPPSQNENENEKITAKLLFVQALQNGTGWREAAKAAGLSLCRTSAYNYRKRFEQSGEAALQDGRQGHPSKLKPAEQTWLVQYCRNNPHLTSPQLQQALQEHFQLTVSVSYLNQVRRNWRISRQALHETGEASSTSKKK